MQPIFLQCDDKNAARVVKFNLFEAETTHPKGLITCERLHEMRINFNLLCCNRSKNGTSFECHSRCL